MINTINITKHNKLFKLLISLIIGTVFTYYINSINSPFSFWYIAKNVLYVLLFYFGISKIKIFSLKRTWLWILSMLLSFFTIVGKNYITYSTVKMDIVFFFSLIILIPIFYFVSEIFYEIKFSFLGEYKIFNVMDKFWARCILMFSVYFIYWLMVYPGAIHVDNLITVREVERGISSMHYPPLFTYVNNYFWTKFEYPLSVGILTLGTMILFVLLVNKCLSVSSSLTTPKSRFFITMYFAFNPIIILWSSSACKDVFFSIFLVLMALETYIHLTSGLKYYYLEFFIYSLICTLIRNNAVYVFMLWAIVMLILDKKRTFKTAVILCLVCVFFFGYSSYFTNVLNYGTDSIQESLSVPLHQMHLVYKNGNYYNKEDIKAIKSRFYDFCWEYYSPQIADSSKHGLIFLDKGLIKMYLKTGVDNPQEYLDAFVSLTLNSFYSDTVKNTYNETQSCLFERRYSSKEKQDKCYNLADKDLYTYTPIYTKTTREMSPTYKFMMKFCTTLNYEKIPVISKIFSIATYTLLYLIFFFAFLQNKQKNAIISFILFGILWGSILLGPCVLYRYYLSFVYLLPFLPLFNTKNEL